MSELSNRFGPLSLRAAEQLYTPEIYKPSEDELMAQYEILSQLSTVEGVTIYCGDKTVDEKKEEIYKELWG